MNLPASKEQLAARCRNGAGFHRTIRDNPKGGRKAELRRAIAEYPDA